MNSRWTRALVVAGLGLAATGGLGCAEERAPINRVQANALAKQFCLLFSAFLLSESQLPLVSCLPSNQEGSNRTLYSSGAFCDFV